LIALEKVSFSFPGGASVLEDLDLTIKKGQKIGIVGDNGSGKTTLLHIIMGLLKPLSGRVVLFGEERRSEEEFRGARRKIGFVFQNSDDQLFCPTVAEDVAFGPRNLGRTASQAHEIVRETLGVLGISHLERRVTYQLSNGEKRLVAIATALAMDPEILVLDEPTAGLTDEAANRVLGVLNTLVPGLLLVCHSREFLSQSVEQVFKLENGRLR
jgi:cobalt/nickel transport system ATP-binding protein